jgi:membrane-associated phospholipid phosphatase
VRFFGLPFLLLNVLMALSAFLCGAHYLVDIIGGIAVSLIAIGASKYLAAPALVDLETKRCAIRMPTSKG